jgi:hypothetical protein
MSGCLRFRFSDQAQNLIELMQQTGQTTALELIDVAGLTDTLAGEGETLDAVVGIP